jgi:hypothetical protein
MKQVVFLLKSACLAGALALALAGCSKDKKVVPPPYAATTQTWTLGGLTWSDAIQMPDCNTEDFEESDTEPQGRSYRSGGNTYYYYNWAYVNANKKTMCPSPWRVPTEADFTKLYDLDMNAKEATFGEWGMGGHADGSSVKEVGTHGYYWAFPEIYYYCYYYGDDSDVEPLEHFGFRVRCVRDH